MLIGAMNHPARPMLQEIEWMTKMGFEFVDLTLEPPAAALWNFNLSEVVKFIADHNLPVVGHTAYYLPICSPFESIRQAAVQELKNCIEAFAQLGATWMNIHPGRNVPMHDRKFVIERNLQSLRELLPVAEQYGIGLMIENLPEDFNTLAQLSQLLNPLPGLGLHLDVGHANLMVERNTTCEILETYGSRLRHVHLHDNKGGRADLHLPLGCGNLDFPRYVRALKQIGYDGTITLEVFTADRHFLAYSRDVLRELWDRTDLASVEKRTSSEIIPACSGAEESRSI
jgi:sugar phosphate isomerase/epimerase